MQRPLPQTVKMMLDILYATYISTSESDVPDTILQKHKLQVLKHASIPETGYYGLAFMRNNNEIYVVHRGTDAPYIANSIVNNVKTLNMSELKDSIISLRNDLFSDKQILLANMPTQALGAYNFLVQIKNLYPKHEITSLGHSLGGALAEICYESSAGTINTVAFDHLGQGRYGINIQLE